MQIPTKEEERCRIPRPVEKTSQLVSMQIKMSAVMTIECFITLGSFKIAFRDMSICIVGLIEFYTR